MQKIIIIVTRRLWTNQIEMKNNEFQDINGIRKIQ